MSARSIRSYAGFVIPAGQSVELNGQGRYVVCTAATADFRLAIDDGPSTLFFAGAELLLADSDPDFMRLTLTNPTGAALTVTLLVGFGEIRDRRFIFSGEIAVRNVDAFYNAKVLDGVAYACGAGVGGVAGQYGYFELFNPVASGVDVIVTRALAAIAATGGLSLWRHSASRGGASLAPSNKLLGGSAGQAEIYSGAGAAFVGTAIYANVGLGNETLEMIRPDCYPIVVPPGSSLAVYGQVVNTAIYVNFEWEERAQ